MRKELFDSPVLNGPQQSSTSEDSPTSLPAKRQRIVSSTKEAIETRFLEHRETVKTHGELIHPIHNLIDVCDHFSGLHKAGSSENSFDSICGQHTTIFDFSNPTEGNKWELPHSVRNELVLAEASSTIPDNTLDQQHMIDEILAENYPIPASAIQVNLESSSSIPWSTNNPSHDRKSQASSEPCDSVRGLTQNITLKLANTDCDSSSDPKVTYHTPKGSPAQGSFLDQLVTNSKSRRTFLLSEEGKHDKDIMFEENRHESLENRVPASAELTSSHDGVGHEREEDTQPRSTGSSTRNAGQAVENDVKEQNPETIDVPGQAMKVLTSSKPKKKRQRSQLEFDESWIGLPKEQAKPRPSRSRSARLHTETIDLSIPPEGATQMKIKRRRTEELAASNGSSPLATNIEAMGEMGFTPNRSKEALTKCGGNLEQAIDELLTKSMSDSQAAAGAQLFLDKASNSKGPTKDTSLDEVLPSVERISHERDSTTNNSEMQQGQASRELICVEIIRNHSRNRRDQEMVDSETRTNFVESAHINLQERPNHLDDEVVTNSNRRKPSRKRKRKETSLDEDGQDDQPSEEQQNPLSALTQSRMTSNNSDGLTHTKRVPAESHIGNTRGCTRQRKIPTDTKDAGGQDEVILKVESGATSGDKNSPGVANPLKEIDANPKTSASDPANSEEIKGLTKRDVTPVEPSKISLVSNEPPQNLTEEPEQKPANKSSKNHSPISKGKVPYRIGLSRKARIAPLLKVMKK